MRKLPYRLSAACNRLLKLSGSKQCPAVVSQLPWARNPDTGVAGSSASGLTQLQSGLGSHLRFRSSSRLILVAGRIHFLTTIGITAACYFKTAGDSATAGFVRDCCHRSNPPVTWAIQHILMKGATASPRSLVPPHSGMGLAHGTHTRARSLCPSQNSAHLSQSG